jgi:hypothetical protein
MHAEWTMEGEIGADGGKVRGCIRTVVIRGEEVLVDGQIVGQPGLGKNVRLHHGPKESRLVLETKPTAFIKLDLEMVENGVTDLATLQKEDSQVSLESFVPEQKLNAEDNQFIGQPILSVAMFTDKEMIKVVLKRAERFHKATLNGYRGFDDLLKRYTLALVFYEPSTRTLHSFENAMYRLGGKVSILNPQLASTQIGESLEGLAYHYGYKNSTLEFQTPSK